MCTLGGGCLESTSTCRCVCACVWMVGKLGRKLTAEDTERIKQTKTNSQCLKILDREHRCLSSCPSVRRERESRLQVAERTQRMNALWIWRKAEALTMKFHLEEDRVTTFCKVPNVVSFLSLSVDASSSLGSHSLRHSHTLSLSINVISRRDERQNGDVVISRKMSVRSQRKRLSSLRDFFQVMYGWLS